MASDFYLSVYFIQLYLRFPSHSPLMASPVFLGCHRRNPSGYDIFNTQVPCFLFEWSHRSSTMGQLLTYLAWTARLDIVGFQVLFFQPGALRL